jgi:hypothetical protein
MLKRVMLGIVVLSSTMTGPLLAIPSDAACDAAWTKADTNKDGSLTATEAKAYFDAIAKSGKIYDANKDGKLSKAEFMQACKDGVFPDVK